MSPEILFQIQGVLGYVAWLLCFGVYVWPRLTSMDQVDAQRAIATLHSFRFFGLVFDDHARRRILFAAASPAQGGSSLRWRSGGILESAT